MLRLHRWAIAPDFWALTYRFITFYGGDCSINHTHIFETPDSSTSTSLLIPAQCSLSHHTHKDDKSVTAPCLFSFDRESCFAQWMARSFFFLFKDFKILSILCVVLFCLKGCLFTTCVLGTCAQKKARDSLGTGVRMVGEPPCGELGFSKATSKGS